MNCILYRVKRFLRLLSSRNIIPLKKCWNAISWMTWQSIKREMKDWRLLFFSRQDTWIYSFLGSERATSKELFFIYYCIMKKSLFVPKRVILEDCREQKKKKYLGQIWNERSSRLLKKCAPITTQHTTHYFFVNLLTTHKSPRFCFLMWVHILPFNLSIESTLHNTCRSRWIFYDFFTWRAPERLQRDFVVICRINLTSLKAKLRWRAEREVCLLTKKIYMYNIN